MAVPLWHHGKYQYIKICLLALALFSHICLFSPPPNPIHIQLYAEQTTTHPIKKMLLLNKRSAIILLWIRKQESSLMGEKCAPWRNSTTPGRSRIILVSSSQPLSWFLHRIWNDQAPKVPATKAKYNWYQPVVMNQLHSIGLKYSRQTLPLGHSTEDTRPSRLNQHTGLVLWRR